MKSPLTWPGSKGQSTTILARHFPLPHSYGAFIEPFCGSLSVLLSLPRVPLECVNDLNENLYNFWMMLLKYPQELQRQLDALPYARALYNEYRESVRSQTFQDLDPIERAVRWFYVQRTGIAGKGLAGWGYRSHFQDGIPSCAFSYHEAVALFEQVSRRLRDVQIECQDFEIILHLYDAQNAFFYVDPPYIGREDYYHDIPPFEEKDHRRLAACLNQMEAKIALSYYPDPLLETLYPAGKWRRVAWTTHKRMEKTTSKRQVAQETLLLNYQPQSLWSEAS